MTTRIERAPRRPLTRMRRVILGTLEEAERESIIDQSYAIFGKYFAAPDRESFRRVAMPSPERRVALLQTAEGVVGGFVSTGIELRDIDGRTYAAVSASVFVLPDYRAGTFAAAFILTEVLRFVLRNPRMPIGYLGYVLGPTTYQRFASFFRRTYPSRRAAFSPEEERVLRAFLEGRGHTLGAGPPWVVDLGFRPLGTATITPERASDPDIRYFLGLNPRYVDGYALAVWIPIDWTTLAEAVRGLVRDGAAEALGWWRVRGRARALPPPG